MRSKILNRILASVVVSSGLALGSTCALATDYSRPSYQYKTITVYENVRKPVSEWVVKYDHCYKPYRVEVVTYRTVKVAVQKTVRIAY
jgi:hypothetical protein